MDRPMNVPALRSLPKVDDLLRKIMENPESVGVPYPILLTSARETIDILRNQLIDKTIDTIPNDSSITEAALRTAKSMGSLRFLINATGIVLHTNLGRAPLAESAAEHVKRTAMGYSNLEYDVETGARGSRHTHAERLLKSLTGCEAAFAVNNNAAAILLALTTLCAGKEAVVSRGELVEIGGSFRVPDILRQSGAVLSEVGTTNRTYISDYEDAYNPETGAFVKIHTSNFKIVGFTEEVSIKVLSESGKKYGVPVIYDLGSGALTDLPPLFGPGYEPTARGCVEAGADVVCFSGDKLLGGPQAGVIAGKKKYIEKMAAHPLSRALRIDKLSLAALEATLRLYADAAGACKRIPVLKMLTADAEYLFKKSGKLLEMLKQYENDAFVFEVTETISEAGGGSLPARPFKSYAVAVTPKTMSVDALEERLRKRDTPVIGRIHRDRYLMDVRTVDETDFPLIAAAFENISDK